MFSYTFDITSLILKIVWCKRNRVRLIPCWIFFAEGRYCQGFFDIFGACRSNFSQLVSYVTHQIISESQLASVKLLVETYQLIHAYYRYFLNQSVNQQVQCQQQKYLLANTKKLQMCSKSPYLDVSVYCLLYLLLHARQTSKYNTHSTICKTFSHDYRIVIFVFNAREDL